MLEKLKEHIRTFSFLGPTDVAKIIELVSIRSCKAGEKLVSVGDVNYNMFFVLKGVLRSHIVKSNGDELTVLLASEGMVAGSSKTFRDGSPSNETVTVVEDCWVAVFDNRAFEKQADASPKLQKLVRELLKQSLFEAVDRVEFHTVLSAQERYEYLLEHRPDLIQRVPQIYLASYLGITPGSLSRIRARMT